VTTTLGQDMTGDTSYPVVTWPGVVDRLPGSEPGLMFRRSHHADEGSSTPTREVGR
jgi:hypothetical protein